MRIPICSYILFCLLLNNFHIILTYLKVKDIDILFYSFLIWRFGQYNQIMLDTPT